MFQILKNMLAGRNEFASGGLLLMVIGAASVWLRAVPEKLWHWIIRQTTMIITVKDDDAAFVWVKEWFLGQEFLKRIRHVDLDTTLRNERISMIPAPGKHWFWFRGRPFEVWFSRSENTHERSGRRIESLTFRTVGRNRASLQHFVDDVMQCHVRRQGVQSWLYIYDDGWDYVRGYAPRVLESVVLEPGEKEHLLQDVARFRKSKRRYERLGVPYHRGYLLYGPPGTGKTSLVSALGAHFGLSIYTVNLSDFSDRSLMIAVNQVPANSVLLFEDIDCMRGSKSRCEVDSGSGHNGPGTLGTKENSPAQGGITLSGLLNILDGFHAPTGVLFVMTTNHVEKLDTALLRPGRIDYKLYMGKASDHQKVELFQRFFPASSEAEARDFVEASRSEETMAEFQGLLLALEQREGRLEPEAEEVLVAAETKWSVATFAAVAVRHGNAEVIKERNMARMNLLNLSGLPWMKARQTHEGAPAKHISAEQELRRSVLACMLWENQFYEDGVAIAGRIRELVPKVSAENVAALAIEAREKMKLRHAPLLLVREMARLATHRQLVADTLLRVIQRADELSEFVALYWSEGKQPLSAQVKKGLAAAFTRFDEYALAKYDRASPVKLRDVLFLCHAKPLDAAQAELWKRLVAGELATPDTWEVALSAGVDKREAWERLLSENKLGALALLRNLRNMADAKVDEQLVRAGLGRMKTERVLPFRFIAAARYAPQWEPELEQAMLRSLDGQPKLPGKTVLLVDVSGSMDAPLSRRAEMRRNDAAYGLAVLLREIAEQVSIFTFSDKLVRVPARQGFALRDAMNASQPHGGTYLGRALGEIDEKYDRIVVITDEQSHDAVPNPKARGYVINVASFQNGVGYGKWVHIDGWSDSVIEYIRAAEPAL